VFTVYFELTPLLLAFQAIIVVGPGAGQTAQSDGPEMEMKMKTLTVCAWCPDKKEKEAAILAKDPNAKISHGICPECLAKLK